MSANLKLLYTLLCDDVRIEMGNKISLMGVFQNIMVEQLPVSLIKFAVINHWSGQGSHRVSKGLRFNVSLKPLLTRWPSQSYDFKFKTTLYLALR